MRPELIKVKKTIKNTKSWFFGKTNKVSKTQINVIRKIREKAQITFFHYFGMKGSSLYIMKTLKDSNRF